MTLTVWVSYTGSVSSYGKCPYLLESPEPPSFQAGVIPCNSWETRCYPPFLRFTTTTSSSSLCSSAWVLQCLFSLQSQQGLRWWLAWRQA